MPAPRSPRPSPQAAPSTPQAGPEDEERARRAYRDEHGYETVGGRAIPLSVLASMTPERRAAVYRGLWVANAVEDALTHLVEDPTDSVDARSKIGLLDHLWRSMHHNMESQTLLAICLATALDAATVEHKAQPGAGEDRQQAAECALNTLAQLGFPEFASRLSNQRMTAALGMWWGEIKVGGKWKAVTALLQETMGIRVQPETLRVAYSRWKRGAHKRPSPK